MRGRSAREQYRINRQALRYYHRRRRNEIAVKVAVLLVVGIGMGIGLGSYHQPTQHQWQGGIQYASMVIDKIRGAFILTCEDLVRSAQKSSRATSRRIDELEYQRAISEYAIFFTPLSLSEYKKAMREIEVSNKKISSLKTKRLESQSIIQDGCP